MSPAILNVFNRYRFPGGEEHSVERIRAHLGMRYPMTLCSYESQEWTGPQAPSTFSQAWRLFYNPEGKRRFEACIEQGRPAAAVFHNIYPVGSPALYRSARQRGLPVLQYLHNYRPFSVGGSLYSRGQLLPDPLYGSYRTEVMQGAWMGSITRSAAMALLLKLLHASGWLNAVHTWIAISDFMRERLVEAGAVHPDRIVTLRHAWDALPQAPEKQDAGYYLFLGRLIEEKGIPTLLTAWDQLYQKLGKATPRLHIAGEGPLAGLITEHSRRNPYICALGKVGGNTKADQLLRCRAVVIPSVWWEPLGLVTYEAYDYAKPVLAARSGGLTETVIPGQTGFLHTPADVENLVQDVLTLESMAPIQRLTMGDRGRHWLRTEAHPEVWLNRFDKILQHALSKKPR
ncbi:Glycosyltransferase involved in cell wall bisynthesis [Prosthecobacter debontii]|uniref:Glycosyltransferase involved in cell wall bisynthesis n=1 Tax=Prosthecobacter debontii TaxID=48467 RepID=A0A1T4Z4L5_9BACT|nr:glycosyltransferase family 4 protein [Prosthecobacter debontii]SKB08990.1 Glycosyltransferase involved in cell wall bisynthesis [Prosthecobacter debontii]